MKPCKRGHTSGRYAQGSCIACLALRRGKKGRRVPLTRADVARRTIIRAAKETREEVRLRKETARAARIKLRQENDAKAKELRDAENARFRAKDEAREERRQPVPSSLAINVQQPAQTREAPDYIAHVDRDGKVRREYLLPSRAENEPKVAVCDEKPIPPTTTGPWAPGCGRQPTRVELAARHKQSEGPAISDHSSPEWFAAACAARSRRGV